MWTSKWAVRQGTWLPILQAKATSECCSSILGKEPLGSWWHYLGLALKRPWHRFDTSLTYFPGSRDAFKCPSTSIPWSHGLLSIYPGWRGNPPLVVHLAAAATPPLWIMRLHVSTRWQPRIASVERGIWCSTWVNLCRVCFVWPERCNLSDLCRTVSSGEKANTFSKVSIFIVELYFVAVLQSWSGCWIQINRLIFIDLIWFI